MVQPKNGPPNHQPKKGGPKYDEGETLWKYNDVPIRVPMSATTINTGTSIHLIDMRLLLGYISEITSLAVILDKI